MKWRDGVKAPIQNITKYYQNFRIWLILILGGCKLPFNIQLHIQDT